MGACLLLLARCTQAAVHKVGMRMPQVTPLLAELRSGHVVANLEALTASAADAARDLHKLQHEVRPPMPPCQKRVSCLSHVTPCSSRKQTSTYSIVLSSCVVLASRRFTLTCLC